MLQSLLAANPFNSGARLRPTISTLDAQRQKGISLAGSKDSVFIAHYPKRVWFRLKDDPKNLCYRWEIERKQGQETYLLSAYPADKIPVESTEKPASPRVYTEAEKIEFLDRLLEDLENLPADSAKAKTKKPETDPPLWALRVVKKAHDFHASHYDVTWTNEQGRVKHVRRYDTKHKAGSLVMDLEHDLTMQSALSELMGVVERMNQTLTRINMGEFPNLTDPDWETPEIDLSELEAE